jgi:hypothetical protein
VSLATWRETPLASLQQTDGWHYDDPVRAMRLLGWETAWVADIGVVDAAAARHLQLDLELRFETDYAKLAYEVAGMVEDGASAASLAAASPFSAERIGHFVTLAAWDWSTFSGAAEGQGALSWGDEPAAAPAPPQASAAAGGLQGQPEAPATAGEAVLPTGEPVPAPGALVDAVDAEEWRELQAAMAAEAELQAASADPEPEPEPYPFAGMAAAIPPAPMRPEEGAGKPQRRVRQDPQLGLF